MLAGGSFTGLANAEISLDLTASHGLQGTAIEAGLVLTTDTELAGINAEIILPEGVGVGSVQMGELPAPADNFEFAFSVDGQNLRIVAWSGNATFGGSGTAVQITLLLGAELLGLKELAFAGSNPDPLVNSQHAVSNADGSESLPHTFSNASFLVYSTSSDHDGDTMPDQWEVENELDPLTDNAGADADEDGYTDLEEYEAGSDPRNPGSTPGRIFGDGFEEGAGQ
jgi:hypothetical protein